MKKFLTLFVVLAPFFSKAQLVSYHQELLLMGSRFEYTVYSTSDELNKESVNSAIEEVKRIENIISEWISNSEISQVNENAGIKPIPVSKELFDIVKRAIKISELTDGAFDISWAAARNLWHFDKTLTVVPEQSAIDALIPLINYKNIILDEEHQAIFLKEKGMAIGLGAIGKGYAANRSMEVMKKMGIKNGIVIAGGDLITWGNPGENKKWQIGIADPDKKNEAVAWFEIGEMAVVTSGDYEHYAMINNKRYGHILDPKTCFPVFGLRSVTIICPDAELADALSTSVFVLGKEKGLELVNQLKGIECVIIDDDGNFYTSDHLILNNGKGEDSHLLTIGKLKK